MLPSAIDPLGALEALVDPILVGDATGRPLFVNAAWRAELGWSAEALAAAGLAALAAGDGPFAAALRQAPAQLAAASGRLEFGSCALRAADGRVQRAAARLHALSDAPPTAFLLQLRLRCDCTAERETLRAVFESLSDGLYIKNAELRYVAINPTLCGLHGRSEEELIGRRAADLFPAATAEALEASDRRALAGERVESVHEIPMPDGLHTMRIVKTPLRDAGGRIVGLCAVARDVGDAQALESALRTSEERLRLLSENIPGVLFSYLRDTQGRREATYHSRGLEAVIGAENARRVRSGEIEYRSLIHPDDLDRMPQHLPVPGSDSLSFEAEYRVQDGYGGYRWVHVRSTRVLLPDGRTRCHGVLLDVDERRRIDSALHELSSRLQALTDQLPGVVFSYRRRPDGHREAVYISPGLDVLLGPKFAWQIQQDMDALHTLIHPEDVAAVVDGDRHDGPGRWSSDVEYRTLTDGGIYRWVYSRASGLLEPDGTIVWHGVIVDIDERKRLESALRQASLSLQTLADNLPGVVYSYRHLPDGRRESLYISPRGLEEIIGPQNAARMRLDLDYHDRLLHPEEQASFSPLRPGPSDETLRFGREYRLRHDDGSYRWVDSRATGFPQADGSVIWHGLMINISRRKRAEEELRLHSETLERTNRELNAAILQAESAIQARGRFLATISHEIRTPLTAILGFAELLLASPERADLQESLELIRDNGHYLLRIINDVLDYSKIEAGRLQLERETFAPAAFLGELCALMRVRAEAKGLSLKLELDPRLPAALQGDPTRLRQILLNLLGNAIKFTEQGRVTLRGRYQEDEPPRLLVDVEDTGIGLPPGDPERLFEAFVQGDPSDARAFGGTGLGLAISRSLAGLLGGDIALASVPSGGSCFTLSVPAHLEPAAACAGAPATAPQRLPGRVLVVEDNATNRVLIRLLLEALGTTVVDAPDGQAALAAVAAATPPFDVILMDIQMPGLDGYEVTRRLREQGCRTPIVALTAHALDGHRERCLAAGCDAYCAKPIDRQELLGVLAACVARSEAGR